MIKIQFTLNKKRWYELIHNMINSNLNEKLVELVCSSKQFTNVTLIIFMSYKNQFISKSLSMKMKSHLYLVLTFVSIIQLCLGLESFKSYQDKIDGKLCNKQNITDKVILDYLKCQSKLYQDDLAVAQQKNVLNYQNTCIFQIT